MRRGLPEGTERHRRNGYTYVKYNGGWTLKGRVAWEKYHGMIPQHHVITYLDGNPDNCDPDNLQCVSRAQLIAVNRNFKRGSDPEITKVQLLWCDLASGIAEV